MSVIKVPLFKINTQNNNYSIESKFHISATLLRPYLDLVSTTHGPHHALSVSILGKELLKNDETPLTYFQINTLSSLRKKLTDDIRMSEYQVDDPRQLPKHLRSVEWNNMCELLDDWGSLSLIKKDNLAFLLTRLGFYNTILQYVRPGTEEQIRSYPEQARLTWKYANALTKINYKQLPTAEILLGRIAENAKRGTHTRIIALINMIVHYARVKGDKNCIQYWCEVAGKEFEYLCPENNPSDRFFTSMYYRAISFLPFIKGDKTETTHLLDLSEYWARQIPNDTLAFKQMYNENLHPLLETRAREAIWLGDMDTALERTKQLVKHDFYDPKTHFRLGDLYKKLYKIEKAVANYKISAQLGTPYNAAAWFMVGECYEQLGELDLALDAYLMSIEINPTVSCIRRIQSLSQILNKLYLFNWSKEAIFKMKKELFN